MRLGRRYLRIFGAWMTFIVLLAAFTGKSLHTHSEEYYRSFARSTQESPLSDLNDDCPLCHFQFFSCLPASPGMLTCEFRLLLTIVPRYAYTPEVLRFHARSFRAPPAAA
ncbi:MAG: hypothetical protein K2H81_03415 [Alistipes sp.]|nr:hypothetical protein [Alistipes sp.]